MRYYAFNLEHGNDGWVHASNMIGKSIFTVKLRSGNKQATWNK